MQLFVSKSKGESQSITQSIRSSCPAVRKRVTLVRIYPTSEEQDGGLSETGPSEENWGEMTWRENRRLAAYFAGFIKSREKEGWFFFNTVELRGVKFENPVVSTLLLPFSRYIKLNSVWRTLFLIKK